MTAIAAAIGAFAAEIACASSHIGRRVVVDEARVADRGRFISLQPPGLWSPNRSCRMAPAADGWIVANLPRESDRELVPAWVGCHAEAAPWPAILRAARDAPWRTLVADARLLGLPVAGVGEVQAARPDASLHRLAAGAHRSDRALKVVDLSSLWAGPLCGAVLAEAGAVVTKIESRRRPDVLRDASPEFFERLNGRKTQAILDFNDADEVARLGDAIAASDIVITAARPRAFAQLGLSPQAMFARNPGLTWVAISGYGWMGQGADRVAFGDDAAAAGGLVRWAADGTPRFLGDALADPLTGLAAAAGALKAVGLGGGFLVDAGLAVTAAGAAAQHQSAGAT